MNASVSGLVDPLLPTYSQLFKNAVAISASFGIEDAPIPLSGSNSVMVTVIVAAEVLLGIDGLLPS